MQNQYNNDINRFVELFSNFSGVSKRAIKNFLKDDTVHNLLNHPLALQGITNKQREKIETLKELNNLCRNFEVLQSTYSLSSSTLCGKYHKNLFKNKDKEFFVVTLVDSQNNIIKTCEVSEGTINEAPVYPREIVKLAIMYDAKNVFLAHNHPGGSLKPSNSDIDITRKIMLALNPMSINVSDHIIVAEDRYFSLAEDGIIDSLEKDASSKIREEDLPYIKINENSLPVEAMATLDYINEVNSKEETLSFNEGKKEIDPVRGNEEYYKYFYSPDQTKEAEAYQNEKGWKRIWGSDSQGLNGDMWVVYRNVSDLPKHLQEYATEQEKADEKKISEAAHPGKILSPEDALKEQLENGVKSVLDSNNFKNWLSTGGKLFYNNYSFRNALLVWLQKPESSYVMGYETWKDYGRNVAYGAQGAKIFIPLMANEKYKGGLYKNIKNNLNEQLAKNTSLDLASYKLGNSNLEFTMNKKNHLLGLKINGIEQQIFSSEDEAKRFIDRAIIGKVPVKFSVGTVFDVKDTIVPAFLWVKKGFTKDEIAYDDKGNIVKNRRGMTKIINTAERQSRFQTEITTSVAVKDPIKMQALFDACVAASEKKGVQVSLLEKTADNTLNNGAKGYFSRRFTEDKPNGFIVIDNDLEITEKCSVLLHEMGHADLHKNLEALALKMGEEKISKSMREVQAEAVAFATASRFGIETDTSSFSYLAAYAKGFELQDFQKSLEVIYQETQELIADISTELDIMGLNLDLTEKTKEVFDKETLLNLSTKYVNIANDEQSRITTAFNEMPSLVMQNKNTPDIMEVLRFQKENLDSRQEDVDIILTSVKDLNEAESRDQQGKLVGVIESAIKRIDDKNIVFEALTERFMTLSEQARNDLKASFEKNPIKTLEAMKQDYPALAKMTDPQIKYIATSKFVSREFVRLLRNDPQAFVDKTTERANIISNVASKNGTFIEVSYCEQWTDKPFFKNGTLCSPRIAENIISAGEKQIKQFKIEAANRGEYFPYTKCDATVFTPDNKGSLIALNTRVDIGDGEQTGLKNHLEQVCGSGKEKGIVLENFISALGELADKRKIKEQEINVKTGQMYSGNVNNKIPVKEGAFSSNEWKEHIASAKKQVMKEKQEAAEQTKKNKESIDRERR